MKSFMGLSKRFVVAVACTAVLATACGGGAPAVGGGGPPAAVGAISSKLTILDGYISGAIVFLDKNKNGVKDANEPVAVNTNPKIGEYTFKGISAATLSLYPVVVRVPLGAVDSDNPNQPITKMFNMTSPAGGGGVISPMTTLIHSQILNNPGMTIADAQKIIKKAIGLPANSTVDLMANYIVNGNTRVHRVAQVVAATVANNQTKLQHAKPKNRLITNATLVDLMVQKAIARLPTIVLKIDTINPKNFNSSVASQLGNGINISIGNLKKALAKQHAKLDKPRITLIGASVMTVNQNSSFVDPGATAASNIDPNLPVVTVVGKVNTANNGSSTITYNVTDKNGNKAVQVTRIVNVVKVPDTTKPVITLIGGNVTLQAGVAPYVEQGAVALDAVVANGPTVDISKSIVITGVVNAAVKGAYSITYNVSDSAIKPNAATTITRTVTVTAPPVDKTPPVIVLKTLPVKGAVANYVATDPSMMTVVQNTTFIDPGATAFDNVDGNIVVTGIGAVKTKKVGVYRITYNVSDAAGNTATQITRTVNVIAGLDTTAPKITLIGGAVTVNQGVAYNDKGATAFDAVDGNLTANIATVNPVNTAKVGKYKVKYNVVDAAKNKAIQATRVVTVKKLADTTPPVISLQGLPTVSVMQGATYTDAGATAFDNVDGSVAVTVSNTVNTAVLSNTYKVKYTAKDAAGNPAIAVVRTVKVIAPAKVKNIDNIAPVITLKGKASITLEFGTAFTDPSAIATDNAKGVKALVIQIKNAAGAIVTAITATTKLGVYTFTYDVKDAAGNAATQVVRKVKVVDTTAPVVTAPKPVTIQATGLKTIVVLGTATVTDAVTKGLTAIATPASTYTVGLHTITWSATDAAGNIGTAMQKVIVQDTTPPVFTGAPLANVAAQAAGVKTKLTLTPPAATDLFTVAVTNNAPAAGFPLGTTSVIWTATDANGQASTTTQSVVVSDTTPPVFTGAPLANVAAQAAGVKTKLTLTPPVATDLFAVTVTSNAPTTFPLGTTQVIWTATDANGQASTTTQNVVVSDTTPPVIQLNGLASMTVVQNTTFLDPGSVVTDNVSTGLTATVTGTVNTAALGTYTLTYNAKDAAGNVATVVKRTVTVIAAVAKTGTLASYITAGNSLDYLDVNNGVYKYGDVSWGGVSGTAITFNDFAWDQKTMAFKAVPQQAFIEYRLKTGGAWVAVDTNKATYVDKGSLGLLSTNSDGSTTTSVLGTVTSLTGLNIKTTLAGRSANGGGDVAWSKLINPNAVFTTGAQTLSITDTKNQAVYRVESYNYPGCTPLGTTKNCNVASYWNPNTKATVNPNVLSNVLSINGSKLTQGNGALQLYKDLNFISGNNAQYSVSLMAATTASTTGSARIYLNGNNGTSYGAYDWTKQVNGVPALKAPFAITTWNKVVVRGKAIIEVAIPASITVPGWMSNVSKLGFTVQNGFVRQVQVIAAGASSSNNNLNAVAMADVKANFNTTFDQVAPVIQLFGLGSMTVALNSTFTDPGSLVTDNLSTGLTATVKGTVNTAAAGTYTLTYNATDGAGNAAVAVMRTITVVVGGGAGGFADTIPPVIHLNGLANMTIAKNATFNDPGSVVTDNVSTGLTATVTGTVNTAVLGSYTLTYNAKDGAGNVATTVTRTVTVVAGGVVVTNPGTLASYITAGKSLDYLDVNNGAYVYNDVSWGGVSGTAITFNNFAWDQKTMSFKAVPQQAFVEYRLKTGGAWVAVDTNKSTIVDKGVAGIVSTNSDGSTTTTAISGVRSLTGLNIKTTLASRGANGGGDVTWSQLIKPTAVFTTGAQSVSMTNTENQTVYRIESYTYPGCTPFGVTKNCNVASYWNPNTQAIVNPNVLSNVLSINGSKLIQGNGALQLYKDLNFISGNNAQYSVSLMAATTTSTTGSARIYLNGNNGTSYGAYDWTKQVNGVPAVKTPSAIATWNKVVVKGKTVIELAIPASITVTRWMSNVSKLGFTVQDGFVRQVQVIAAGASSSNNNLNAVAMADVKANFNTALDQVAPVITLNGLASMTVVQNTTFSDPGSVVTDNLSTGLTSTVTGTVDTTVAGSYRLVYRATDGAGNTAVPVTRTVTVVAAVVIVSNSLQVSKVIAKAVGVVTVPIKIVGNKNVIGGVKMTISYDTATIIALKTADVTLGTNTTGWKILVKTTPPTPGASTIGTYLISLYDVTGVKPLSGSLIALVNINFKVKSIAKSLSIKVKSFQVYSSTKSNISAKYTSVNGSIN